MHSIWVTCVWKLLCLKAYSRGRALKPKAIKQTRVDSKALERRLLDPTRPRDTSGPRDTSASFVDLDSLSSAVVSNFNHSLGRCSPKSRKGWGGARVGVEWGQLTIIDNNGGLTLRGRRRRVALMQNNGAEEEGGKRQTGARQVGVSASLTGMEEFISSWMRLHSIGGD